MTSGFLRLPWAAFGSWNLRYFTEGAAHELGEETVLEPNDNEAVVFEEFFMAGLRMLSHPTFTEILL
jgi:hypothetical protein